MTEDDIITLGDYCEGLLSEGLFHVVSQQFEAQCFAHFMQTEAKNVKEREAIYARLSGLHDFLAHLTAIVAQRDKLTKEQVAPSDDEDAPEEDID